MIEDEWIRPNCLMCGKELSDLELGLGLWHYIYPGCDYYNAGGFCTRPFGKCAFEEDVLCERCADRYGVSIYVGDACMDLKEACGEIEYDDDEVYDGWEDPMDEAYHDYIPTTSDKK